VDSPSDFLIEAAIPTDVIALVPGSVAFENVLLPFFATAEELHVLVAERLDAGLLEKMEFIFRRRVRPYFAREAAILLAILHYYGMSVYEEIPSMLVSTT
jgi:hypothetical protein